MRRLVRIVLRGVDQRWSQVRRSADSGMSTAEYAVGTVAACSFAAVLWAVVHSGAIQDALIGLVTKALNSL
jgi:hypothetical protein